MRTGKRLAFAFKTYYLDIRHLILFDRGYPSADFLLYLQGKGIGYVRRASKSFYKEIQDTAIPDEWIRIEITKARAEKLKERGKWIPAGSYFMLPFF